MLRHFVPFLAALLLAACAHAASQDDNFLAAREAFRVGDAVKFERAAKSLGGYVLEPYVDYWRMKLRLENADADEVRALLVLLRDGPVAARLRADWLKVLGMKQQWELFDTEYPQLVNENAELACYALQSRLRIDAEAALRAARAFWFSGREQPESCNALFETLAERGHLTVDDVWARIRLALEAGNTGVARRVAEYLPKGQLADTRAWAGIAVNAQSFLDKKAFNLKTRAGRETVMFVVHRLARTSPALAAQRWTNLGARFSDAERGYVWGVIALLGAQRHDPNALRWYALAGELNDLQRAWQARAALRAQSWPEVLAAIDRMSARESREPAWRYWKARALQEQGNGPEAQALLAPLALEFNFYGQLAAEDLGGASRIPAAGYQPNRDEVQAMARVPGLQRALAFYRLNLRFEGNREWIWAIRGFDDKQLLTAAEFARRHELYDRAINTAEKTIELHDFSVRYLAPYRDVMKDYVRQQGLDEAWVYGLIRQESRFIADARSRAGATGLMQLMPATARWVAQKIGLKNFRWTGVSDVGTNINLGTWYLRHVLDALDNHPVLASAAYNAGPGRARGWRAGTPMEAAVYAETIPFNETRDYVKKVMSNASYYSQQFGQTLLSFKERIGVIVPRTRAADKLPDEPGG
ncbi:MAG: lytic transglycosylase domain-containing protein [Betaproteobacteria bacterium]|nr:lytic transglycosylase domain-containing protein [Betaproteobacteria bacterium]